PLPKGPGNRAGRAAGRVTYEDGRLRGGIVGRAANTRKNKRDASRREGRTNKRRNLHFCDPPLGRPDATAEMFSGADVTRRGRHRAREAVERQSTFVPPSRKQRKCLIYRIDRHEAHGEWSVQLTLNELLTNAGKDFGHLWSECCGRTRMRDVRR